MDTNPYRKLQVLIITGIILAVWGANAGLAAPQLSYEELATVADDHVIITWVSAMVAKVKSSCPLGGSRVLSDLISP